MGLSTKHMVSAQQTVFMTVFVALAFLPCFFILVTGMHHAMSFPWSLLALESIRQGKSGQRDFSSLALVSNPAL